jgi:phospholipase A1/A2
MKRLIPIIILTGLSITVHAARYDLPSGLANCARIPDADSRLACFDRLATQDTAQAKSTDMAYGADPVDADATPAREPMTAATAPPGDIPAKPTTAPDADPDERAFLGVRPYRRNYLLPVTYNDNPNRNVPREEVTDIPFLGDALDDMEMKFQISFEIPLWTDILDQDVDLYFGYTQLAFFQAFNREYSSPFRETNYEPELGLYWEPRVDVFGWRVKAARLALNHQSNGESDPLSRSWNRFIGEAQFEQDALTLGLRLWAPLITDSPSDNPDIYDYYGYGELRAEYALGKHHFGLMFRNPRRHGLQLDWSYPLSDSLRLYVQYFNGYGESLLDYDHVTNRVGVGLLLNNLP